MIKPIIESKIEVTNRTSASNFLQKVFNLFDIYIHNKIIVHIETLSGQIVLDNLEIRNSFEFDIIGSVFARNTNNIHFICTVMVKG